MRGITPIGRSSLPVLAALVALIAWLGQGTAQAISSCLDFGGGPITLTMEPVEIDPELEDLIPDELLFNQAIVPLPNGPAANITDLDVSIRARVDNISDFTFILRHTVINATGGLDVKTIPLLNFSGCAGLGYPTGTYQDSDIAVYLDDDAFASVDFACDRTIPVLSGRLQPTRFLLPDSSDVGLNEFNGRQAGAGFFELIIRGPEGAEVELIEVCLLFNNIQSGDVAPRKRTPGVASGQSGNAILTVADHIESARFLLGYNSIDDRVFTGDLPDDLSSLPAALFANLLKSSTSEYTRLDAAPASSTGDGLITVADWVQTTRYADGTGFDEPVAAGGPLSDADRIVRIGERGVRPALARGQEVMIPVLMRSKGVEHEVAFGVQYDAELLEFVRAERGSAVPPNANFQLNNEVLGDEGTIGFQVGLLPGQTFPTEIDFDDPAYLFEPVDEDVQLARFYFRALPGSGAVATELTFVEEPLFFANPSVRNMAGIPQYASFVSGGITIIDNADARPTVRVVDTVLSNDSEGTVQIALDSVGLENAVGFTLNFPPEIELLSASRGRDVPFEAFFYTNPDEVSPVFADLANTDGRLRVLIGLQPGKTFDPGRRILLNLRFRTPFVAGESLISDVEFSELGDTIEVTDPFGIPLVSRFPDGQVIVAGDVCDYTLSESGANFTTDGGAGSFEIQTASGCPWVATSTEPWVTITGSSAGFDSGTVTFTVAPNNGGPRVAEIEIVGETFTITQDGCEFQLNPGGMIFSGKGGSGSFEVLTTGTCSWDAESLNSWIVLTSSGFGTGDGVIEFLVEENVGGPRSGRIRVADQEFVVEQRVCTFAVEPILSPEFAPNGGSGSFEVVTDDFCPWTVEADQPWVTLNVDGNGGTGPAVVSYTVGTNLGGFRTANVTVEGRTHVVQQAGLADCDYAITPDRTVFSGSGGTATFQLQTTSECPWEVTVPEGNDEWITILSQTTGMGNATIQFEISVNEETSRFGVIRVGGLEHEVQQFGGNEFPFEFRNSAEGWTFGTSPAFNEPEGAFELPEGAVSGRLNLITSDNANTFGYWASPELALTSPTAKGDLFEARFAVSTDKDDPLDVPVFRLRGSSADFHQTNSMVVTPAGNGSISPTPAGRSYRHLFTMPANTERMRLFFDVLNFSQIAAADARISLQEIVVLPFDREQLVDQRSEARFLLANAADREGWQTAVAPPMAEPQFSTNSRGLAITSGFTGTGTPPTTFGSWGRETGVALQQGRIYRLRFLVSARAQDALPIRKTRVPAFRLRLNDASMKAAGLVTIESTSDTAAIPTFTEKQAYELWYRAPESLAGSELTVAFDYLLSETANKDPKIELILESVEIDSFLLSEE